MLLIKIVDKIDLKAIYFEPTDIISVRGYDRATDKPYVMIHFRRSYSHQPLTIYNFTFDAFNTMMDLVNDKECNIFTLERTFVLYD